MEVEIKIDRSCTGPRILIITDVVTEEINSLVRKLSGDGTQLISGSRDDKVEILEPEGLVRIYANAGKVYAVTGKITHFDA